MGRAVNYEGSTSEAYYAISRRVAEAAIVEPHQRTGRGTMRNYAFSFKAQIQSEALPRPPARLRLRPNGGM
jgi:hypothetical protein